MTTRKTAPSMAKKGRNLLVVVAHPDDESVLGGTIARYARENVEITLVCTTDGAGGVDPRGAGPKQLAVIRQEELRQACEVLGVTRLEFLEDREPLLHYLTRENYAGVVGRHREFVGEILEEIQPDVVVTFGPEGFTGHPTHIMVGHLTTQAVFASSIKTKLYYVAFSAAQVANMQGWFESHPSILRAYAEEVKKNPRLGSPTPVLYPVSDEAISATIDITDFLQIKLAAMRCHRTQGGGGGILDAFGVEDTECFVRVLPPRSSSEPREHDLFARLGSK